MVEIDYVTSCVEWRRFYVPLLWSAAKKYNFTNWLLIYLLYILHIHEYVEM